MERKQSPVVHFLPSLTDVAFLLPLLLLFSRLDGVKTLLGDGDTGWHVRTGEWILAHQAIPHKDLFSFTKPDAPWFAWEWLWDLAFGWLHLHWGLSAVVIASIVVICLTSAGVFRLILMSCPNRLIAIGITFLAVTGSSIHWLARPHLFTIFFTVIWISVLQSAVAGREKLLWMLPLLMLLWTNVHGGFVVGIVLTGTYAAGALLDGLFALNADVRVAAFRRARVFAAAVILIGFVTLANPYGYHLHEHILEYLTDSYQMDGVAEYQTLTFHNPATRYLEGMLVLSVLSAVYYLRCRRFTPALLMLSWGHFALVAARNIPLFLMVSAPFVAQYLSDLLDASQKHIREFPRWAGRAWQCLHDTDAEIGTIDRAWRLHAVSAASILFLCIAVSPHAKEKKLRAEYDPEQFPTGVIRVLSTDIASARIFSRDQWGDYLEYRLYPSGRVFIDGRSDFFGDKFLRNCVDILEVNYDWEARLAKYQVNTLVLSANSAIAEAAKLSPHWKLIYDDGIAVVLRKRPSANEFSTPSGNERATRQLEAKAMFSDSK